MGLINGSLIDSSLSDIVWLEKYQKLEQQLSQLQQEKEDLRKWLEEEISNNTKIYESKQSAIFDMDTAITMNIAYKKVLNKLKGE